AAHDRLAQRTGSGARAATRRLRDGERSEQRRATPCGVAYASSVASPAFSMQGCPFRVSCPTRSTPISSFPHPVGSCRSRRGRGRTIGGLRRSERRGSLPAVLFFPDGGGVRWPPAVTLGARPRRLSRSSD